MSDRQTHYIPRKDGYTGTVTWMPKLGLYEALVVDPGTWPLNIRYRQAKRQRFAADKLKDAEVFALTEVPLR